MEKPIIELQNVSISFDDLIIHRDISFAIYPGEVVTILGPSGAGKTLILKTIIGLLKPDSGRVMVLGTEISALSWEQQGEFRKNIGMLFQGAALFDSLTVFENIAYSLHEAGGYSEQRIAERVAEKLGIVDLPGVGHKYPSELSGGQKKRIGLARALASEPKIMLFDEPTTGLDPTTTRLIDELISCLKKKHQITSVVVTHDIASAKRFSDRWILINNGRVAASGPVEKVIAESQEVVDFINGNWKAELRADKDNDART